MSGYAIVLHGDSIRALVVGGGPVAARKVAALHEAGAAVRVIAPELSNEMQEVIRDSNAICIRAQYERAHIADANLVFACTDSPAVNADVARDATVLRIMVNVASDASVGTFSTPATHRAGAVLVSVYTGGVPAAALRIRDAIAAMVDAPLASAVQRLAQLRSEQFANGASTSWKAASTELVGSDFLESVANGEFERRFSRWG